MLFKMRSALVLALTLAVGPAFAQETNPEPAPPDKKEPAAELTAIKPESAPPGAVVTLSGKRFLLKGDKLRVEVGGKEALVTVVQDDRIIAITSLEAKIGKGKVTVKLPGGAELERDFEILDPKKLKREEFEKDNTGVEEGTGAQAEVERLRSLIKITAFKTRKRPGGLYEIAVIGEAPEFIDELRVMLVLSFDGGFLGNTRATIAKGRFEAIFGPYQKRLFPGVYRVEADFSLYHQRRKVRLAWYEQIGREQALAWRALHNYQLFQVGDESSALALAEKTREDLLTSLGELRERLSEIQELYATTVRCLFREGNALTIDEARWEQWVTAQRFASGPEDLERLRKNTVCLKKDYLNPEAWESTARAAFAKVAKTLERNDAYTGRFALMRFHEAHRNLRTLASMYLELYLKRTALIYRRSGLRPPPSLVKDSGIAKVGRSAIGGAGQFRALANQIERQLNGAVLAPSEDEDIEKASTGATDAAKDAARDRQAAKSAGSNTSDKKAGGS